MRKTFYVFAGMVVILSFMSISCNTQVKETEEPAKIENTLQSVSYFQDTVGLDPSVMLKAFTLMNEAIDEIGYPDAGYKLWLIQEDTADIRFMVEGFWPDQETYDIIHDHQLFNDAMKTDTVQWEGIVNVEYHRFVKIK
ncbi:MAG TPA: hypothetical protein VMW76_01685 [Bacteroidales bacterium]|nr:hypothetical protein [Bacteroidales bacterium]